MESTRLEKLLGWMAVLLVFVGVLGLISAFFAMVVGKDFVGAGICLFVAAFSFAKVLNI